MLNYTAYLYRQKNNDERAIILLRGEKMKIYLDVLMFSNIIITLVFIRILSVIVHIKLRKKRLFICMIPAAASSLLLLISPDNFFEALLITFAKIIASMLIVKIAIKTDSNKKVIVYTAVFIAENIAFGGVCMLIWEMFGGEFLISKNYSVYFNVPLPLLIGCVAASYGLITLYERILFITKTREEKYKLTFTYGDFFAELPAVSDSGNRLIDSFSGEPVIVFSSDRVYLHFDLDNESSYGIKGFHMIPYSTVNGTSLLPVTLGGKVIITNSSGLSKDISCAVGITKGCGKERAIFDPRLLL